jgi:hypothetical protein
MSPDRPRDPHPATSTDEDVAHDATPSAGEAHSACDRLMQAILSLHDLDVRRALAVSLVAEPSPARARELDELCRRADLAELRAVESLASIVDALFLQDADMIERLREHARAQGLWSLERLVRFCPPLPVAPPRLRRPTALEETQFREAGVPDYGYGRPLTVGERKSLARRPTRAFMDRLLCDPHPAVVLRLLVNPRLTEDDVVRLAARRQDKPEVLRVLAQSPRWLRSRRVRVALACNPDTPLDISTRLVRLMMRSELELIATSPTVPVSVRQICLETLERRPPSLDEDRGTLPH